MTGGSTSNYREAVLNVAAFARACRVVGPGLRDALWVQGCSIRCAGCANHAYFAHEPRRLLPVSRVLLHFETRRAEIDGISVLGGEPTEQAAAVGVLLEGVHALGLSTVVFTGQVYENLLDAADPDILRLLSHTDLLIDGPFVERLASSELRWRGSSNQRLLPLTPRLRQAVTDSERLSGEIILGPNEILLNGVGLVDWFSQPRPGVAPRGNFRTGHV